jgi:hypothetical protein
MQRVAYRSVIPALRLMYRNAKLDFSCPRVRMTAPRAITKLYCSRKNKCIENYWLPFHKAVAFEMARRELNVAIDYAGITTTASSRSVLDDIHSRLRQRSIFLFTYGAQSELLRQYLGALVMAGALALAIFSITFERNRQDQH